MCCCMVWPVRQWPRGEGYALKGAVSTVGAEKAKKAISEFLVHEKGGLSWQNYQSLSGEGGHDMFEGKLALRMDQN